MKLLEIIEVAQSEQRSRQRCFARSIPLRDRIGGETVFGDLVLRVTQSAFEA